MRPSSGVRTVVLIWLGWAAILIPFQNLALARYQPERPDYALSWTPSETRLGSQNNKPYLIEPFLNAQVSWDSEFYLSISTVGYDDPAVRAIEGPDRRALSLNYAFFPLYPYVIRVVALPLRLMPLTPIARSTLAGVVVSLLGTLAAMLALYDLARGELGDAGGSRAAFYLLIFPMGFFLAQVYTEGLFVGLAFGALALIRRRRLPWAALLAALATWTRPVGAALAIPLALDWWSETQEKEAALGHLPGALWAKGLLALAPLAAYGLWRLSFWGAANAFVESHYFGRGLLLVGQTVEAWSQALASVRGNPQAAMYYGLETALIALALVACLRTRAAYPGVAWFGLAVLVLSLGSGVAQSVGRYVLVIPSLYLFLAQLGKDEPFDRAWTLASILLMGMLATLFAFDMWVA